MDNTPTAPAPAPEAGESVAPNTNSNQGEKNGDSTEASANTAPQVSEKAQIPADQVEAWNRFMENNGGFSKAFQKVKNTIANPQPQAEGVATASSVQQPESPQEPAPAQANGSVEPTIYKPSEGFITPTEYFAQKYNEDLALKYPGIADYIKKGEYLKEGTAMGMTLIDQNGNMNNKVINEFLEMKEKAVAPTPTSTPITTTPTVDYQTVEGDLSSREQATKIMQQGEGHPQYKQAVQFMRESIFGKPKDSKK